MSVGRGGVTSREQDEHILHILHMLDVLEVEGAEVFRARFQVTNNVVQGMRYRFLNPVRQPKCLCERPENRDGAMGRRWWAGARVAAC